MKKIIYILPGAFLLRFKKNESLLKFPSIISMLNINLLFNPLNLPGMGMILPSNSGHAAK